MKKEYKELLLKDLCCRLQYGVKISVNDKVETLEGINTSDNVVEYGSFLSSNIEEVKPYLFPLSSMTEEQKCEYNRLKHDVPTYHYEYGDVVEDIELYDSPSSFEYLIKNRFDVYDLIPLRLANQFTIFKCAKCGKTKKKLTKVFPKF